MNSEQGGLALAGLIFFGPVVFVWWAVASHRPTPKPQPPVSSYSYRAPAPTYGELQQRVEELEECLYGPGGRSLFC